MLRVAIWDDNVQQLEKIQTACRRYFAKDPSRTAEILTFANPILCLEKLEQIGGCDIALPDICMMNLLWKPLLSVRFTTCVSLARMRNLMPQWIGL